MLKRAMGFAVACVMLVGAATAQAQQHGITVSASGEVKSKPTIVEIGATVAKAHRIDAFEARVRRSQPWRATALDGPEPLPGA